MNLTQWKKDLKPGQIYYAFNHIDQKHLGSRSVQRVQSNAVTFKTEKGESWLYFPKAKDFKALGKGVYQIYEDGVLILTYSRQW